MSCQMVCRISAFGQGIHLQHDELLSSQESAIADCWLMAMHQLSDRCACCCPIRCHAYPQACKRACSENLKDSLAVSCAAGSMLGNASKRCVVILHTQAMQFSKLKDDNLYRWMTNRGWECALTPATSLLRGMMYPQQRALTRLLRTLTGSLAAST